MEVGLRAGADVVAGVAPNWKELPLVVGAALVPGAALQLPNSDLAGVCTAGSAVAVPESWPNTEPLSDEAGAAGVV